MGIGLEEHAVKTTPRRTLARWVSAIVHPIAFPLVTLAVVIWYATYSWGQVSRWVLLSLLLTSVPITLVVVWQVTRGHWTDLDVSVRKQRYTLYPFGLLCMLLLLFVFLRFSAPRVAVQAIAATVIANVIDGVINLRYKVSGHATAAAVCAMLLALAAPTVWGAVAVGAALAVGWSRVELRRHTLGQVLLGWGVGAATTALAVTLIG